MQCPSCKCHISGTPVQCPECGAWLGETEYDSGADSSSNSVGTGIGSDYSSTNDNWVYQEDKIGSWMTDPKDIQKQEADEEKKDLIRKIIIMVSAFILVVVLVITVGVFLLKPDSSAEEGSGEESAEEAVPLTEEEALEIVEEYFKCYAVKTSEVNGFFVFDCYGTYNKQTGEYNDKLGTVQIDPNTGMMHVMSGFEDVTEEAIMPMIDPPVQTEFPDEESEDSGESNSTTVVSTKYVYNVDYGLYLWTDTVCSDKYCVVLVGDAVGFIEEISGTNYAKVSYGNYIGYLNKNYLSDSMPNLDTTVKYSMYSRSDGVSFREGPSENYKTIYTLSLNAEVGYIRDMVDNSDYAQVSYNGVIGYVRKQSLTTEKINNTVASTKYVCNVDYAAWLWKTAAAKEVYCMVLLGEAVGFIENDSGGQYAKVNYNGTIGYINNKYLSDTMPIIDTTVKYDMYVNADNTPFKAAPTTSANVNKYLSKGTCVGYIMNMNDASEYAKVYYNGTIGYILYSCLSDSMPTPSPSPSYEPDSNEIPILDVDASSVLSDGLGISYEASNICDNNTETAWVEGVLGDGIDEYLILTVPSGTAITEITIKPGYCKSESLFYSNGCPTELEFSSGGESTTLILFEEADSWSDCKNGITFFLGSPIISDGTVTVTIRAVRAGRTYSDTAISEIILVG